MSEPKDVRVIVLRNGGMHFEGLHEKLNLAPGHHTIVVREVVEPPLVRVPVMDFMDHVEPPATFTLVERVINREPKYDTVHIEPPAFRPIGVPRYLPPPPPLRYKLVLAIAAVIRGARA